jgi:segregation and condensation protein B
MTHGEEASRGNDLALVEAALFLASRPLTRRALAKILGDVPLSYVDQLLGDLQGTYADEATGIELMLEEGRALLRVKSAYVDRVAHLAPQQDIPQPVLRTLAVIAYNHPATQADVVRTRGNKAYEHIQELIERGLVRGEDHGRTILLHVTDEFLRHFGLSTIDEFRFHVAAPPDEAREPAPESESEPASETQEVHDG